MNYCNSGPAQLTTSLIGCTFAAAQGTTPEVDVEFPLDLSMNKRSFSDFLVGDCVDAPSRKRPRVSKQKNVRFMDVRVNRVIPRSVCKEDLPSIWYNRADYRSFREDAQSLALAFELGILDRIHPDDFCLRGLEASLSREHLEARITARGNMNEVILSTQEAQRGHRMRDPEMIRGLSIMLSKDANEDALKLAVYDRAEAETAMEEHRAQS